MAVEIIVSTSKEFTNVPSGHVVSNNGRMYLLSLESSDENMVIWTCLNREGRMISYRYTEKESIAILNSDKHIDLGRVYISEN